VNHMRKRVGIEKLLGVFGAIDVSAPERDVAARANP